MLVVTKKFEVVELNILRLVFLTVLVTIGVAFIAGLIPNIPNGISLAISIPLSLLTTLILEVSVRKKNKVFDEERIEQLLSKIAEQDEFYVQDFFTSFIQRKSRTKTRIKLDKSAIIDEIDLLASFILSSFPQLKRQLPNPDYVAKLFNKTMAKGWMLEKEYGVDFHSLAFLYESNAKFYYHNYLLGANVNLNYTLSDDSLLMQKSFLDFPLLSKGQELLISKKFRNHPYKTKYADLETVLFYDINEYVEGSSAQSDEFIKAFFCDLYDLFMEVKDKDDFFVLSLFIAYDLFCLIEIYIKKRDINLEEVFTSENVRSYKELQNKYADYLSRHPIVHFFFMASFVDFNVFADNIEGFQFSDYYTNLIVNVYYNELNRKITNGQFNEFSKLFDEVSLLEGKSEVDVKQEEIYRRFAEAIKYNKPLSFDDFTVSISSFDETFNRNWERVFEYNKMMLSLIPGRTKAEVNAILDKVFCIHYSIGFFKVFPIYCLQPLEKFSKYLIKQPVEVS